MIPTALIPGDAGSHAPLPIPLQQITLFSGLPDTSLLVHPDIPYTSHNSCAVIHVQATGNEAADRIFAIAEQVMIADFIVGSDPGLAVAPSEQIAPAMIAFGKDAKCMVLTQEKARALAKNLNVRLKGLGGTEGGVIGSMAGLGLAVNLNDGRYLQRGKIRDMIGPCTVEALLAAGVEEVCTLDGKIVTTGTVMIDDKKSPKACPINGRTILFVEDKDGVLVPVKRD